MRQQYDILDTSNLCFEGDFDTQVEHILQTVRLSRSDVQKLRLLFDDLEYDLQQFVPGCKVLPFGSIITGLGIGTSDVDCFVMLPNGIKANDNTVFVVKAILQRNPSKFTNLLAIHCNVPILKFLHKPTNCYCDLSFKNSLGVRNSELIAHLLSRDPRNLPLAVLVKYWSKVHKLTGTNLLASYALTLLVIFYLQTKDILPPICRLQTGVYSSIVNYWETAFDENAFHTVQNTESLYELLGGFFKYYSTFDFDQYVISPFMGRVITRKEFLNVNGLPEELTLYKSNVTSEVCKELRLDSCLCVQDPFEHNRNCTLSVYPRLKENILYLFRVAARVFDENEDHNFLEAILTEQPEVEVKSKKRNRCINGRINKFKNNWRGARRPWMRRYIRSAKWN